MVILNVIRPLTTAAKREGGERQRERERERDGLSVSEQAAAETLSGSGPLQTPPTLTHFPPSACTAKPHFSLCSLSRTRIWCGDSHFEGFSSGDFRV